MDVGIVAENFHHRLSYTMWFGFYVNLYFNKLPWQFLNADTSRFVMEPSRYLDDMESMGLFSGCLAPAHRSSLVRILPESSGVPVFRGALRLW